MIGEKMLWFGLRIAAVILVLDQVSKWLILNVVDLPTKQSIEITSFFNLSMVWNRGVSFGLFSAETDTGRYLLAGFAIAITSFLTVWLARAESKILAISLGLVIGGAIGNVIDRLIYGAVADFLDFHALGYHFYTFNVADTAISLGVAFLIFDSLFLDESGKAPQKS